MSVVRVVACTGCQYMVAARKMGARFIVTGQMLTVAWSALGAAGECV